MKKRSFLPAMLLGAMMACTPAKTTNSTQSDIKAARIEHYRKKQLVHVRQSGGMDLVTVLPNTGLTPKEYGIRYGNGKSRKSKTNYLRLSRRYKIRRAH